MCKTFLFSLFLAVTIPLKAQIVEMEQDMFENMREGDKAVVVAVHAGAGNDGAQHNIDRLNRRLQQAYPNYDFREAWTEHKVGQQMPTPDALLSQLQKDGYTHVLVQSSSIIDDVDMQYLRHVVDASKGKFKHIRLGEPLLSDLGDYDELIHAMIAAYDRPKVVNVLVCNGTVGTANAQYTMLDYALHDSGFKSWFVGTLDGYPSLDHVINQLKLQKIKKVNLIPFMFTEDAKSNHSFSEEWPKRLEKAGYKVTTETHDIGELDSIIDMFENHIRHAEKYRALSAKEQKLVVK